MKRNEQGFTLIEIMIVVIIVGILASVAYPSYVRYVKSTAESQVQGELIDLAAAQERWKAQNFKYTNVVADLRSPIANNKKYSLSLSVADNDQTFVAEVTPKSGSVVAGEASFKIDQDGTTCYGKGGCTLGSGPSWSKK